MKKIIILIALLALSLTSCDNGDNIPVACNDCDNDIPVVCEGDDCDDDTPVIECEGEIYTAPFYVFDEERRECGYQLFFDTGSPGHFHGMFYWAEDLPEEFREYLLPVMVTFCVTETERECGIFPVLDILNITFNIK